MYSLFISTYDKLITISLLKNGELLENIEIESNQNHSSLVIPNIEKILSNNDINTSYLNEIIVVNGPGSFTGVRLGVTVSKTLAYTLNIPIKTITSLECMSVSIEKNTNKLSVIFDLKGAYVGYFDKDNNLLEDYVYLNKKEYEEYVKDKKDYLITDYKFDVEKIYRYLKLKNSINPHLVNPIYIKGIDALNDK